MAHFSCEQHYVCVTMKSLTSCVALSCHNLFCIKDTDTQLSHYLMYDPSVFEHRDKLECAASMEEISELVGEDGWDD